MKRLQRTIRRPAAFEGTGLFTGQTSRLRFLPAMPNTGVVFVRTDLPSRPRIPARIEFATVKFRRTTLSKGGADIDTVEHVLSAVAGLALDNLEIEIDSSEVPCGDGSALPFLSVLRDGEIVEQEVPKISLTLPHTVSLVAGDSTLVAIPATEGLTLTYTLEYPPPIGQEYRSLRINEASFAKEIAPARTFCMKEEIDQFVKQGLGKGASYKNTLIVDRGGVVENTLRFPDEFVRHKMLDLLGDLYLLNAYVKAHVIALRSGHSTNLQLVQAIAKAIEEPRKASAAGGTVLDMREIAKILPHRFPFLLIDKVVEMDSYKRAVGIKNVTYNEPFFQGHFPDQPIMPGVLQLEAMAQLAGVLLMRKAENQGKLAVLLSLDKVKLRKTVVPGDQLRITAEALRVKNRTGMVYGSATVDGKLVAEAYMKFMLIDNDRDTQRITP